MFKRLEGDTCVIRQGGVFKAADLYSWRGGLFAATSGGYVRLRKDCTTSKPSVMLEALEISDRLYVDKFDRLSLDPNAGPAVHITPTPLLRIEVLDAAIAAMKGQSVGGMST